MPSELHFLRVLTPLLITAALSAQQVFGLTGPTSFVTRGSLGTSAGELLQGFPTPHHRGIGEQAGGCIVQGTRIGLQDQNSATAASYEILLRGGTDANGPTNALVRVGPFRFPPGGGGPTAFLITTTFQTPVRLPGCDQFFAAGVSLPAAPTWTADGLSVQLHTSQRVHARAQSHAWEITPGGTLRLTSPHSFGIELLTRASVMQIGTGPGSYGMDGLFPATGSDITARARFDAATFGGGVCALWLGTWRQSGTVLFPGTARLYLSGTFLAAGRRAIGANGEVEMTIARNIPGAVTGAGVFHFQAAGIRGSTVGLTNAFSIVP